MEITIKWTVDSKSDEEAKKKVMALLKNAQGTLLTPLPDWDPEELRKEIQKLKDEYQKLRERYAQCEMDIYNRDDEIQDLKLENDHLKQRDEIMYHFLQSVRCKEVFCDKCDLHSDEGCYWRDDPSCKKMWNMIDIIFDKLEEL